MTPPNEAAEGSPSRAPTNDLVARYQAGDKAALEHLLARHYGRIRQIVRVRAGPEMLKRTTVDDVLHDVLARVIDGIETFEARTDAHWLNWVATLAANEIRNQARNAATKKRGGPTAKLVQQHAASGSQWDVADPTSGVVSKVARAEEMELLEECMARLPEDHKTVIELRDLVGMDWHSIAEEMHRTSPQACQELNRRAKRALLREMSSLG